MHDRLVAGIAHDTNVHFFRRIKGDAFVGATEPWTKADARVLRRQVANAERQYALPTYSSKTIAGE